MLLGEATVFNFPLVSHHQLATHSLRHHPCIQFIFALFCSKENNFLKLNLRTMVNDGQQDSFPKSEGIKVKAILILYT